MKKLRAIWKFVIKPGHNPVPMPAGARVLHAAAQGTETCIWAEVCPNNDKEVRNFFAVGTGNEFLIDEAHMYQYIGTCHFVEHGEVGHVYEVYARPAPAVSAFETKIK